MFNRVRRWWHGYWAAKHAEELVAAEAELLHAELELKCGLHAGYALGSSKLLTRARRHRLAEYAVSVYRKNLEYHEEKLKQCSK